MSKAKKETAAANNPVENLEPVNVIDATTTKSDAKRAANIVEQTANAETVEANKANTIQALKKHFEGFEPAGVEFDASKTRADLKKLGYDNSMIAAVVKAQAKAAKEITTLPAFLDYLDTDSELKNRVQMYCGNACLEPSNIIDDNNGVMIYSTEANDNNTPANVCEGVTYYVEYASVTAANIIKSIQTYSIKRNAVAKLVIVKADQRLKLDTFARNARALMLSGTSAIDLFNALKAEVFSGKFGADIIRDFAELTR